MFTERLAPGTGSEEPCRRGGRPRRREQWGPVSLAPCLRGLGDGTWEQLRATSPALRPQLAPASSQPVRSRSTGPGGGGEGPGSRRGALALQGWGAWPGLSKPLTKDKASWAPGLAGRPGWAQKPSAPGW